MAFADGAMAGACVWRVAHGNSICGWRTDWGGVWRGRGALLYGM